MFILIGVWVVEPISFILTPNSSPKIGAGSRTGHNRFLCLLPVLRGLHGSEGSTLENDERV
jgi:hypothetical protein